jgi:hypothetical protein
MKSETQNDSKQILRACIRILRFAATMFEKILKGEEV